MKNKNLIFALYFVKIRCLQIYRMFAEAGIGYLLVLLFVAWLLGLSFLEKLKQSQHYIWSVVIATPTIVKHFLRKDNLFLKYLSVYKSMLYAVEYLIFALPLLLLMAFYQPFTNVLFSAILVVATAFLPTPKPSETIRYLNFTWIPLTLFEWKSGFRKIGILLIIIYFLTLIAAQFVGAYFLFVLMFSFSITSLFNDCEPKEWLPRPFSLSQKVAIQLSVWTLIVVPHLLLFLYFHFDLWYLALYGWFFGAMTIAFCLAYKYALWSPFRKDVAIDRAASIFIGMMLIVFTAPACVLALAYYWRKVKRNYQLY